MSGVTLASPSRPLKSTATIAHHNRTEVRDYCSGVGYCASLERPLDKRRGERKRKRKNGKDLVGNWRELDRAAALDSTHAQEKEQKFRKSTG